jgi:hypothetical protein
MLEMLNSETEKLRLALHEAKESEEVETIRKCL